MKTILISVIYSNDPGGCETATHQPGYYFAGKYLTSNLFYIMEEKQKWQPSPESVAAMDQFTTEIETLTRSKLVKIPFKYGARFISVMGEQNEPKQLVELKVRDIESDKYESYGISVHKCVTALLYGDAMRLPFILYVKYSDGRIGYVEITSNMLSNVRITPSTRENANDIEPCITFPTKLFTWLD